MPWDAFVTHLTYAYLRATESAQEAGGDADDPRTGFDPLLPGSTPLRSDDGNFDPVFTAPDEAWLATLPYHTDFDPPAEDEG